MSKKDEDAVRFSDLFKKDSIKKELNEDEKPSVAAVKEREPFRLSDLNGYKSRSRLNIPLRSEEEPFERKPLEEKVEKEQERDIRRGLETFRMPKEIESETSESVLQSKVEGADASFGRSEIVRASEVMVKDRESAMKTEVRRLNQNETEKNCKQSEGDAIGQTVVTPLLGNENDVLKSEAATISPINEINPDIGEKDEALAVSGNDDTLYEEAVRYLHVVKEKIVAYQPFVLEPAVAVIRRLVDVPGLVNDLYPRTMILVGEMTITSSIRSMLCFMR
jgi:hypothetical protein